MYHPGRRDFIKTSCRLCAGTFAAGFLFIEESCSPVPGYKTTAVDRVLNIPMSAFKGKTMLIVHASPLHQPIFLWQKNEHEYKAVLMKCTHRGYELEFKGKYLNCPAHGSKFDFDGKVLNLPAKEPLKVFETEKTEDQIRINLG